MDFVTYCSAKNIHLLRDDIKFIRECINKMPYNERKAIMRGYIANWLQGYSYEENALHKENAGRRMANSWLRERVTFRS